jgi:hypothetical protein
MAKDTSNKKQPTKEELEALEEDDEFEEFETNGRNLLWLKEVIVY